MMSGRRRRHRPVTKPVACQRPTGVCSARNLLHTGLRVRIPSGARGTGLCL